MLNKTLKILLLLLFVTGPLFAELSNLPIQHGGRVKPFDSFSREVVQMITGSQNFEHMKATDVVLSWVLAPEQWTAKPVIEITSLELKQKLGLAAQQKYFSFIQIQAAQEFSSLAEAVYKKGQSEEKLNPFEKTIERLSSQVMLLDRVFSGELLTLIPPPEKGLDAPWFSLAQLSSSEIRHAYGDSDSQTKIEELKMTLQGMSESFSHKDHQKNQNTFSLTSLKLKQLLSELPKDHDYPYVTTLSMEVFFNEFHPFRKAWIFYVLSLILFTIFFIFQKKNQKQHQKNYIEIAAMTSTLFGFLLHVFGFYLRCSITGRPPVGTMYESVIWVSLGAIFFSFILFYSYRNFMIVMAASAVAAVGLILADNLPMVLDPTIRPLAPVLRSNFWLTIHVLTITLSYAAFALAMGLGNWTLFKFFKSNPNTQEIKQGVQFIYRSIQIGVLLLAAGTILGGVWADYSWGRFWGWDPKEVWALIALLLYLAVIHGKFAGWLKDFGMVAASILAFQGVLMAWYGVNFVLGVGLHSYGFGSGGLIYVLLYILAEVGLISYAWSVAQRKHHPQA